MPPHAIATFLRACARRRLATAGLLGVVVTSTAHAQVVLDPAFSSDTVGAGEYAPGLTTDYLIREAYGRRAGDNLFHRFSRFDIPTGQSATFVEDAPGSGIRRVVAHVGGATVTRIDGVLRSTIPGADLYLYNARGVVVGPEGRLDLQGSFHASTASDLHFADGVRFGDSTPGAVVTLTSADPTAWGFLSTPAPITLEGDTLAGRAASLVVPDDATLSLVGGAITIDGPGAPGSTPSLAAPSGTLALVAVGAAGEVAIPDGSSPAPDLSAFPTLAPIQLREHALVDASGRDDQTLVVRGDSLSLDDATILADHLGPAAHPGRAIDVEVRGAIRLGDSTAGTGATILSTAFRDRGSGGVPGPDVGDGGDVRLVADSVTLDGPDTLVVVGTACANDDCYADNRPGAAGGDLAIDVDRFSMRNGATLVVQNVGTGTGGDLTIDAREVVLGNDAGQPARTLLLSYDVGAYEPGTSPPPDQQAGGGDVTIRADERVRLEHRARIVSETDQNGRGGDIRIETARFEAVDTNPGTSASRPTIQTLTLLARPGDPYGGEGRAGDIDITTTRDLVLDRAVVSSRAAVNRFPGAPDGTPGDTGDIRLSAPNGTIDLVQGALVDSQIQDGTSGGIELAARAVRVRGVSVVQSTVDGDGTAGDVVVRADDVLVTGSGVGTRSGIFAKPLNTSDPGLGASGSIRIDGRRLRVDDGATINVSSTQNGAAGDIVIGAATPLAKVVLDGGTIEAETSRVGASGGNVDVAARHLRLERGARITTANTALGDTGTIRLVGEQLRMTGGSEITTSAGVDGAGGDVTIRQGGSILVDHATIRATAGAGATPGNQGGNLDLAARAVVLSAARLDASAPAGAGGAIRIQAGRFVQTPGSVVTATGGTSALDGEVQILSADTNVLNVIPRPTVAVEDPTTRLAMGCDRRTEAQGSLYALPPVVRPPPPAATGTEAEPTDPRAALWARIERAERALDAGRDDEAIAVGRDVLARAESEDDVLASLRTSGILARALDRRGERDAALDLLRRTARRGESLRRARLAQHPDAPRVDPVVDEALGAPTQQLLAMLLDDVDARQLDMRGSRPGDATSAVQPRLREVRDLLETIRSAELEDHFEDACLAADAAPPSDALPGTLVLYPILLEDRVALLTGFEGELAYHRAPIEPGALAEQTRTLRGFLEKRTTRQYLRPAAALYEALVRPIEAELARSGVETLVVVPEGILRTIPFAALYDATSGRFLVDLKPVAVVPSLRLTRPAPIDRDRLALLAAGLEQATAGFERLDHTREEIDGLAALFPDHRVLFDDAFRIDQLEQELRRRPYSILHLATHGRVEADGRDSFLLASDGRLGLERMSELVATTRFRRDQPLELLTLSACETAADDEDAALGLAGVALRAGARSALATLWPVNDEATARLVDTFYRELAQPGQTRAGALRAAQQKVREQPRFAHPGYWAAFLMISSWM
ncbi:MAG: CHAT domain-containing protein [Spirochaetaceae bacterium]|nr:CHAT domain-containing protein [Spirochaetaceae bacterium]